jgi:ABC-type polysaccharide/polyol phosphate transport system ATPase subunit
MTKEEVDEKFDSIIEFADIGAFLDTPGDNFKVEYVCDPQIKA